MYDVAFLGICLSYFALMFQNVYLKIIYLCNKDQSKRTTSNYVLIDGH